MYYYTLDSIGFSIGTDHFQGRKQSTVTHWTPTPDNWLKRK